METETRRKLNNTALALIMISLVLFSAMTVSGEDRDETTCESEDIVEQWYAAIDGKIVPEDVCTLDDAEEQTTDKDGLCLL